MGTKCAPTYAKIFIKMFKENYIYHLIQEKCKLYLRYIEDKFLIWTRTLDELNKFRPKINQVHPSIKFKQQCKFLRHNSKKIFHEKTFDHSQKIRTPGVYMKYMTVYQKHLAETGKTY